MDPYVYPGTNVLRNKPGIKNESKLFRAEIKITGIRCLELLHQPIQGNFDFEHLKKIHYHIFQDLYTWAGEVRTTPLSKGNTLFCMPEHIVSYAENTIFPHYADTCRQAKDDPQMFARTLAENYAELNMLHPFREGNGRTQREFARELCLDCGYFLNLQGTTHEEMLDASIASAKGDNSKLNTVFTTAITSISRYKMLTKANLPFGNCSIAHLPILSNDDIPENQYPQYQ